MTDLPAGPLFPACPECGAPTISCVCPAAAQRAMNRPQLRETMQRLGELNGGQMPYTVGPNLYRQMQARGFLPCNCPDRCQAHPEVMQMTMNVDELQAGPDLDALVAEKVMGWTPHRVGVRGQLRFDRDKAPTPVNVGPGEEWSPSTDIAAAWEVVERMKDKPYDFTNRRRWSGPHWKPEDQYLTQEGYPLGTTCWYVRVETGGMIYMVCADTAPLAICRAALKAVGA